MTCLGYNVVQDDYFEGFACYYFNSDNLATFSYFGSGSKDLLEKNCPNTRLIVLIKGLFFMDMKVYS